MVSIGCTRGFANLTESFTGVSEVKGRKVFAINTMIGGFHSQTRSPMDWQLGQSRLLPVMVVTLFWIFAWVLLRRASMRPATVGWEWHFENVEKCKQEWHCLTFTFLADTKLRVHGFNILPNRWKYLLRLSIITQVVNEAAGRFFDGHILDQYIKGTFFHQDIFSTFPESIISWQKCTLNK